MPTNEDLQNQISNLTKELNDLKELFYKDEHSNLKIFRKKTQFNGEMIITLISKTKDSAPIGDGDHTKSIPVGGGSITITTKNGIITNIS